MTQFKTIIIAALVLVISFLHVKTMPAEYELHILHRELFFIPIILASFWFGMTRGIGVALLVCIVYAPLVVSHQGAHGHTLISLLVAQLVMYLFVAWLIGWLSDRKQMQHQTLLDRERTSALAKAAAALSFEIKDVVNSLDNIRSKTDNLHSDSDDNHFEQELKRLNLLAEVLSHYIPPDVSVTISSDLNELLDKAYDRFRHQAKAQGIGLTISKDPDGCPTMIVTESLSHIIEALIENALDASERGGIISVKSIRGGDTCTVEVSDQGEGIRQENRKKLFSPFFTTKHNGSGLALAAGRKVLRDHGGDLIFMPGTPNGSIFRLVIPRETIDQNISEFARVNKLS